MNIVLIGNTYLPHVGGVARSVAAFREEYQRAGHEVLVVAPAFADQPAEEAGVVRIPALQNFNASDFSVALPLPSGLMATLEDFAPDVIHSQHPFLLGMTALRAARMLQRPLVFTHHTLYEEYTHYVPMDSPALKRFVVELATCYANLTDLVVAPSESIRHLLLERGVETPVEVIPTGVYVERFARGNGAALRREQGIPQEAFVVGHMGRLAWEKNVGFLTDAVIAFLREGQDRYFLLVGGGDAEAAIVQRFEEAGLSERLKHCGVLEGEALADAMNAMNLFAFASKSETQGMVLTEAMASGLPVVALDASGVREVVRDGVNGRLLRCESQKDFGDALHWVYTLDRKGYAALVSAARETAEAFSMRRSADRALQCYESLRQRDAAEFSDHERFWDQIRHRISAEVDILRSLATAGDEALEDLNRQKDDSTN
ncbi:glycosyltransferase [Chromatocurvus halotolerans]|uniref:Glycosyltransferase involved in cell wall biosynthesis n=1 Tax=Chromatocurvus halotolerans TaxID=1132028 RepID=A0A4R2KTN6_9GAMM|nr:glycosyltransferase [Chromatocurvus halotolerans]TCO74449.1 glycosyltransferase involved in cell wall biosynthesis [Chromatocurvus halotolerans]